MKKLTGIERCRIPEKKKKIDKFVKAVFIYWVIFVALAWITYWIKDSVPDTLIQYGLGGGAIELACTAVIEIVTNKRGRKNDN